MLANPPVKEEKIDPRVRRTRQLLMQAFVVLLNKKSFDAITVQEIADQATVNRATFYAHFDDKYALLDSVFAESFNQALQSRLPPGSEYSPQNLQRLIRSVCEFVDQLGAHCARSIRTQFDSLVERQAKIQLYEFLLAWFRKSGTARAGDESTAELRATVGSWAIYGAATRWSQSARKESAEEFARQALPLIMAGLDTRVSAIAHKAPATG